MILNAAFGRHMTAVALALLAGIGLLSSLLANIPVVEASLVMAKGYLVAAQAVPISVWRRASRTGPLPICRCSSR
jgi:Na+/H+ antiporter NhaD/arsenite permease-like protein